eukprot:17765-Rhodomonas_salina.1
MEGAEGREGGKSSGAEGLLSTQLEMLLDHQERKLARSLSSRRKSEEDLQVAPSPPSAPSAPSAPPLCPSPPRSSFLMAEPSRCSSIDFAHT